ncbi:saccharopine dehydrogenase (NADP+, L-glutamate forming) [Flexibacter flexilis DSM 6793]|uniref:Saccharopine dehydrogenase (NADP+, L-glutamate forming) n=1 Tax=Flexibacter flexilis DSM 6793 TaxID=927664 RepID=A0A1I1KS66_9BACT|nr:saccharopine dehydrogenase C-terminal domain-containing protein [Flexibacter flexilis]SFC60280.1 saccharopine dehydrogenase (NADP+, L-glutamate forming) [Flexibacter flexilis DSM 6793]
MKNILLLGAGRSASSLIRYLHANAAQEQWSVTVADASLDLAQAKTQGLTGVTAVAFDINDTETSEKLIAAADLVISMLPAFIHPKAAVLCLKHQKHLITASYVSAEMKGFEAEAKAKNLVFLNECGLDPGIDHMSAMQVIDEIHAKGGKMLSFKSYCGGLVAPESDNNPWGYKFSWNPRNVILAGQGTVKYLIDNQYKYLPYHRLFAETECVEIEGFGKFDAYANRDSLSYRQVYGLDNIPTILRGTLRKAGYCEAWNIFVQLGITDDSYLIENIAEMTYADFIMSFLPKKNPQTPLTMHLASVFQCISSAEIIRKIKWTGILDETPIGLTQPATPAQVLQHLLEQKWKLEAGDKDMIVMQHQFEYEQNGQTKQIHSSLVTIGQDETYTAMADTVGLPLGIAAKLILQDKIKARGVLVPVSQEFYKPILAELASMGIVFQEKEIH